MPPTTGPVPETLTQAFDAGRFGATESPRLGVSTASGPWKIPVILVDFSDQRLTYASAADWNTALFDTTASTPTGSVFDYYRSVSAGRLRVVGKVVAIVHLDNPKSYYANNSWGLSNSTPRNSAGALLEALGKCSSQVDWSEYDRDLDGRVDTVWLLHAGLGGENTVSRDNLWSITTKLSSWTGSSAFVTQDPIPGTAIKERVDAFSVLPELSAFHLGNHAEIGVFCHEFGHSLGLPDLYDTHPSTNPYNVGPGNWSLMSTGAYGTDGQSPEYPSHLGGWAMTYLGWSQPVRPTRDTLITLHPLETTGEVLQLWFQGETGPERFLVENRQRLAFDRNLVSEGAIISLVNDVFMASGIPSNNVNYGIYPGLQIVEADGRRDLFQGINHGDPGDPMPGGSDLTHWDDATLPNSRSLFGYVTNVAIRDIAPVGDDLRLSVQVRSPGWLPPRVESGPDYQPIDATGHGSRAVLLDDGAIAAVTSEAVAGGAPQVVVRDRHPNGVWDPPIQVSLSPGSATEPTVCGLPGGTICVVWSDSRHGLQELYFRSRIGGVWTPERRLTDLPGTSREPCIGADARGRVHLAWLYNDASGVQVDFMSFTYLSPFGDPIPVTPASSFPDLPTLAMAPGGSSYILWADRATTPTGLWFSHFSPDSGLSPPRPVVPRQGGTLPLLAATVDGSGALHVGWLESGVGGTYLHYQRRATSTSSDTIIVARGEPIQDFALTADPDGGIHLIMEAADGGGSRILYKRRGPDARWDIGSTEVTTSDDGVAVRPSILARSAGSVTTLYTTYAAVAAFVERSRNLAIGPLTAVSSAPIEAVFAWRIGPNPLRPGTSLRLVGQGAPPPGARVEVFDLSGRRVAEAALRVTHDGWAAEVPGSRTREWSSGVYFAHLGGSPGSVRLVVLH
jgi:immune inhibitor A